MCYNKHVNKRKKEVIKMNVKFNEEGYPICPKCGGVICGNESDEFNFYGGNVEVDIMGTCNKYGADYEYWVLFKSAEMIRIDSYSGDDYEGEVW